MRLILRNLARTIKVHCQYGYFSFSYTVPIIVTVSVYYGWGTRKVCGYFHYKRSCHRRSCYYIKVGRVVARTSTTCANDRFYYCGAGWLTRRICITAQVGYTVRYKNVYRCHSYTTTRLVKGSYQCKNYYFYYHREFNVMIQAANK